MGIINAIGKEFAKTVGVGLAIDALDATGNAIEGGEKVVRKVINKAKDVSQTVSKGITKQLDKNNTKSLKKEAKKQEYVLFVSNDVTIGKGVYTVTNKEKEQRYNTLLETEGGIFRLSVYNEQRGRIATVSKLQLNKPRFFTTTSSNQYLLTMGERNLGHFIESKENKADVVITDFNNWIATGELKKDNYKVFDKKTGKTIATISKKYASASSYSVECEFDSNEPIVTIMTILIDLIY